MTYIVTVLVDDDKKGTYKIAVYGDGNLVGVLRRGMNLDVALGLQSSFLGAFEAGYEAAKKELSSIVVQGGNIFRGCSGFTKHGACVLHYQHAGDCYSHHLVSAELTQEPEDFV